MKSDIQLDINTKYNDEGLKKLEQGLTKASKTAKTASGAVSQISGALGGLENSAGKAVGALTGLFQSFTQGGVWGMAVASVMLVVNKVVDGFNKAKLASKEAAETAKKHWLDALDKISQRADINITNIEKNTKTNSEKYSLDTQNLTQQQQIEVEKVKQAGITRRANLSEDERAVDKAKEDVEIAKMVKEYSDNSGKSKLTDIEGQIEARSMGQREKNIAASRLKKLFDNYQKMATEYSTRIKELRKKQDAELVLMLLANPDGVIFSAPYQKEIDKLTSQHSDLLDKLYGSKDDKGERKSEEGLESRYKAAKKAATDYRVETLDLNLDTKRRNILTQNELDDTKQTTSVRQAEERLAQLQASQAKKKEADEKAKKEKSDAISKEVDELMKPNAMDDILKSSIEKTIVRMVENVSNTNEQKDPKDDPRLKKVSSFIDPEREAKKNQIIKSLGSVHKSNEELATKAKDDTQSVEDRSSILSSLKKGLKTEEDLKKRLAGLYKEEADAREKQNAELKKEKLKALDDELDKAKNAVEEYKNQFLKFGGIGNAGGGVVGNGGGDDGFANVGDFGTMIGGGENDRKNRIGKQQRAVDANKKQLERLLKIRNPDKRTQDEIAKREKFDDIFNPKKIKEREDAVKAAEKAKVKLIAQLAEDLKLIKQAIVGGITL